MITKYYSMQDDFELKGLWWLPQNPDEKLSGTLIVKGGESIVLELIGGFNPIENWGKPESIKKEVILGLTTDGKECTLTESRLMRSPMSFPGIRQEHYRSRILLIGHHFERLANLLFTSYHVNYEYLEEWVGSSSFSYTPSVLDDNLFGVDISVNYSKLVDTYISSLAGKLAIETTYQTSQNLAAFELTTVPYVSVVRTESADFNWYLSKFYDIQHLLTLLMGEPTYSKRSMASFDNEVIHVYYAPSNKIFKKQIYNSGMLIKFSDVASRFGELVDTFLSKSGDLRPTYDLFFGSLYRPNMYIQSRFLTLMQALERYHRVTHTGKYLPDDEYDKYYKEIVSKLPAGITGGLRDALKSKLKYGNEHSLKKRLRELLGKLDERLRNLVSPEYKHFVDEVVDTRHYLTHYDPKATLPIDDNREMLIVCQRLRILITILLLQGIGLDDDMISKAIANNRSLTFFDYV